MSKLTDEQLELAAKAYYENRLGEPVHHSRPLELRNALRAAAPYLQMPWDEPTSEEVDRVFNIYGAAGGGTKAMRYALVNFTYIRNLSLEHKKGKDPRMKLYPMMKEYTEKLYCDHDLGKKIQEELSALDEVNHD